jgi:hypothetical protein
VDLKWLDLRKLTAPPESRGRLGMDCNHGELKVYCGKEAFAFLELSMEFEQELDQLCKRYGLHRCASEQDITIGVCTITYDRKPPK